MLTPYMPWYGYPTASISPLQAVMGQCRYGRQSDCSTLKWVLATASPSAPSPLHGEGAEGDRKSTRLNSSHQIISYAVFCLKKKKRQKKRTHHIGCHRLATPLLHPHIHVV